MLLKLTVQNYILIDSLALDFQEGICVLTGETGAGKSILIDAVSAILGGRIGLDVVRAGCERALLEATFRFRRDWPPLQTWLSEHGIEPEVEGELTLMREISARGTRCRVEGVQVPLAAIRELGEHLVDILGQHEHTLLTRSRAHLGLLDRFAGSEAEVLAREVSVLHARRARLRTEQAERVARAAERERQRDFWSFQLAELEALDVRSEDDLSLLRQERTLLQHAESLQLTLGRIGEALTGGDEAPGVLDGLSRVLGQLREAAVHDPGLEGVLGSLNEAREAIAEASRTVRYRQDRLEPDPERLEVIDQRLDHVQTLLKKYGPSLAQAQAHRERLERDLGVLGASDARGGRLAEELSEVESALWRLARSLTAVRDGAAGRLSDALHAELADLGLKDARFEVQFRPHAEVGPEGAEGAEFFLAANPGETPRPLARTASGGELARIMLALKTVLTRDDAVPTLIFDEVDTGISGRAAQVVARKIAQLGRRGQILLITHMPAIAAVADAHWRIEKVIEDGRTSLSVSSLDEAQQVSQLAHLASGDSQSSAAIDHGRELRNRALAFKHAGGQAG